MSTESTASPAPASTRVGHPGGLFLLFFVEMWERFSYYGMRALLTFYIIKGFLKQDDSSALAIYGAYTSLVYATPFIGGMLSDRLLGARRAVILGGMLMAAGHLLMMFEDKSSFYAALALLICGNGFFKPNISTMVGALYPAGSPRRDGGFTIFYMGINLGAAMSPLICGYIGETFGWHYGFGIATIGMLAGLLTFVVNTNLSRILIGITAVATAGSMVWFHYRDSLQLALNAPIGIALVIAAFIAIAALAGGGLPDNIGRAKDPGRLSALAIPALQRQLAPFYLATIAAILLIQHVVAPHSEFAVILMIVGGFVVALPWMRADVAVYLGTLAAVPVVAILLQNTAVVGLLLGICGGGALLMLAADAYRSERVERERMYVVFVLLFFSMLFFAIFEQAGSSVSLFTDRNVDRIIGGHKLTDVDVGQKLEKLPISSALLGREVAGREWDLKMIDGAHEAARKAILDAPANASKEAIQTIANEAALTEVKRITKEKTEAKLKAKQKGKAKRPDPSKEEVSRDEKPSIALSVDDSNDEDREAAKPDFDAKLSRAFLAKELQPTLESVEVTSDMVGMKVGGQEVKASLFQAANAIFILILGLPMAILWSFLATRRLEPNTAVKFALGLLQLGLGFAAIWLGTVNCSSQGLVAVSWLLLGYLLHTSGELCLSPVGLSMVTKLSPVRMVSTVMGAWFLASAFSSYLAGMIAALAGTQSEKDGGNAIFKLPIETVHVYGGVFAKIAIAACVSGIVLLILSPLLVRWMHIGEQSAEESKA